MLVAVRFLHGSLKTFLYFVPQALQLKVSQGVIVQVSLRKRIILAVVESIIEKQQNSFSFSIKPILSIYDFLQDVHYERFIKTISYYYQTDALFFMKRIQKFLNEKEEFSEEVLLNVKNVLVSNTSAALTSEQQVVYQSICHDIQHNKLDPFVLYGVTGSGKTEIYKKLIKDTLEKKQSVIFMVPEVSLAIQFEAIFNEYLSQDLVIGFHSATTIRRKRYLWQCLQNAQPIVIIGVHLPILLPIKNIGLIVVDEEHDAGYQEKKHPKLQSRDIAILRASFYKIPLVLGSATPSIQTLWNVNHRKWPLLQLKTRFSGSFPLIKICSLQAKDKRDFFWITEFLQQEIQKRLEKKEQIILFLNRRGYCFFVQCLCGYVFSCTHCSVSLTLHYDQYLMCHYCGYKELLRDSCPSCFRLKIDFLKKGIGTQQIVISLQKLFPFAVIARADADTTSKKRTWKKTVDDMHAGAIDILVGTQSIAKGYHFAKVTLVGVLWADSNLHFPMYNAAEITLQQLIQVAGRAGRWLPDSLVVIQTFDQHMIYQYADELSYSLFYEKEIKKRMEVGYPPCKHIAEIEIRHKDQMTAEKEASFVMHQLAFIINEKQLAVDLYGPVAAIVYKMNGVFLQKILLKSFSRKKMIMAFESFDKKAIESDLFITIDPVA